MTQVAQHLNITGFHLCFGFWIGKQLLEQRVEIENPGRFPADINPNELEWSEEENKKNTSQPQNEILANVLYLTGTTEHWGRGLALMYDECDRTGVERPRYFNTENLVRIVFKRPDMSKWTHDGFFNDTVAPENDTVDVSGKPSKVTAAVENDTVEESKGLQQPKYSPSTAQVEKLILAVGTRTLRANDIMNLCGYKSMRYFRANYLHKALEDEALWLEYPNSPNAPNQRYRLSDKALAYYLSLSKEPKQDISTAQV